MKENDPFIRYTPRAQQVMSLARSEAIRLGRDHIGPEHIMLGIIRLGPESTAARVLKAFGVELESLKQRFSSELAGPSVGKVNLDPGFEPWSVKILALAEREAQALGNPFTGTENLLVGLLTDHDNKAAQILYCLYPALDPLRQEVLKCLGRNLDTSVSAVKTKP